MTTNDEVAHIPVTLLDLLSNSLILYHTLPLIPVADILSLASTSKAFQALVFQTPRAFRYLDLSPIKSPDWPSWRKPIPTDMLEQFADLSNPDTVEQIWSRPYNNIFDSLARRNVLEDVQTLILDGLTVPFELVTKILDSDRFNVRILSIRDVQGFNEAQFMLSLPYLLRPTRPQGPPKLKGLYFFGSKDQPAPEELPATTEHRHYGHPAHIPRPPIRDITPRPHFRGRSPPAGQIGGPWNAWNIKSYHAVTAKPRADPWVHGHGRVVKKKFMPNWGEYLSLSEDRIAYDAVLCRGPRHTLPPTDIEDEELAAIARAQWLPPAVATISLGPSGCSRCHSSPEKPAIYGISPADHFPLLGPPPLHSSTVKAAKRPPSDGSHPPRMFLRCSECVKDRWCERCNKWWCEDCYTIPRNTAATFTHDIGTGATLITELQSGAGLTGHLAEGGTAAETRRNQDIKVLQYGLCYGCLSQRLWA